jgi:hypothetical protein
MLNDVGYELADANVNLNEAFKYAKQSVEQQEDKTQDVYLETVTLAQVKGMVSLAHSWDTLGWVHFRMGHMDEAQKYLSAAWNLEQSPVIGDHLGILYEKMGKTQEAISFDKMTLATRHAPPATVNRLTALLGEKPSDHDIEIAANELMRVRTIKLPRLIKASAHGEFFIVVTPGTGITNIKFINGSEELRSAGSAIASAHFTFPSPDNRPAKLFRRGILDCTAVGANCEFVLLPVESVDSIN